ncbi:MAG: hypothetical protein Q8L49_13970 [Burkholderiaceae bacterium]|nr:hypothetical protein [Burkholderiaceae bacterium]
MRQQSLDTRWENNDLLVLRNEQEIDRIPARDIHRVILVCHGGDSPSDLRFAVVETTAEYILLPAASGIAGRVHFERQGFWMQRPCIYWVDEARAPLPRRLLPGVWLLRRHVPGYVRLPHDELASVIESWPLQGPQSWEQRKWAHIVRNRMLASAVGRTQPRP